MDLPFNFNRVPLRPTRDARNSRTPEAAESLDRSSSSKPDTYSDILLAKFIMAHVKENVYLSLQKIFNLKSVNKRQQYKDKLVQYLEKSMAKGLCMTGYQAVLLANEKKLPPDVASAIPKKYKTDEEKNAYLAQFLCNSDISKNIINSCDKHYAQIKPNRVPLYMRKPT